MAVKSPSPPGPPAPGVGPGTPGPPSRAARASESGRPELLAGGTATLREMLDTVRVPSDFVESGELTRLSLYGPDLTRNDEDWESHCEDEDRPDPGNLQY